MSEFDLAKYKTQLIDELEFLLMMAQKNDMSLVPGLEVAISTIEGIE